MRIEGTLKKWSDDRGFGFITADRDGAEFFVHISAFPHDGQRPMLGERLSFEIETDSGGKKRAVRVMCPNRPAHRIQTPKPSTRRHEKPGLLSRVIPLAVITTLGFFGYKQFENRTQNSPTSAVAQTKNSSVDFSQFRCDGRQHCSQMTSCAEATFFLKNCPDVKMDGDHDGIPCEEQWCSGAFAK